MTTTHSSATAAALATFQRLAPESQAWPSAPPRSFTAAAAALAAFHNCKSADSFSDVFFDAGSTHATSGGSTPRSEFDFVPSPAGKTHLLADDFSDAGSTRATSCVGSPRFGQSQQTQQLFQDKVMHQVERYRGDFLEATAHKLETSFSDAELMLADKDRVISSLHAALKAKDDVIAALEEANQDSII